MAKIVYIYHMKSQEEIDKIIANFCEIVEEASHFFKKNNKHFPIRRKFFQVKMNLPKYLYNRHCVYCQEYVQINENVIDNEPYVLVKMQFKIDDRVFTFHTPKKSINWEYEVSVKKVELMNTIPARKVFFEMQQTFKIIWFLKGFWQLGASTRKRNNFITQLEEFLDWKTSDKLREASLKSGVFD